MTLTAFLLIVLSAGFHASWNLVAKKNRMSLCFYWIICAVCTSLWLHVQFWTPVKLFALPWKFWAFACASVGSDALYCFGLMHSYRVLAMSTAYPIMRALPILLTAFATALLGWGAPISGTAYLGFFIVFCGALLIPLQKFSDFSPRNYLHWSYLFILLVACGTTGYTICDKQAMTVMAGTIPEISTTVRSLTYYSTRGVMLTSAIGLWVLLSPANRADFREVIRSGAIRSAGLAGAIASATYVLVLLSMNYVTNVTYVSVFRQLGLPIGMLMGVVLLKEKCPPVKWVGVVLILTGLTVAIL